MVPLQNLDVPLITKMEDLTDIQLMFASMANGATVFLSVFQVAMILLIGKHSQILVFFSMWSKIYKKRSDVNC